jgi:SAM-dependent methyltransferase
VGAKPIGVDVAQAAVDRARAGHPELEFRLVPIDGPLPFDDVSFDVVWASEVIEHVADTARWLSEVRRVLVPRGRLLLTTPSHGRLRVALGGIERFSEPLGEHLHLYTRRSLANTLGELGFDGVEVRAVGGPPGLRRMLLGRANR